MAKRLLLYASWIVMAFLMSGCSFTLIEKTTATPNRVDKISSGNFYIYDYQSYGSYNNSPCYGYISDW